MGERPGLGNTVNVSVEFDLAPTNSRWDAFVERNGGHHVQSSMWAQVKRPMGWSPVRVLLTDDGEIVAGTQVLQRSAYGIAAIGHAPYAPVVGERHDLALLVVEQLCAVAKANRIKSLVVQPPTAALEAVLHERGFAPTQAKMLTGATLLLDLQLGQEELLATMKPKTRYNIRLAERRGVTVRLGGEADLPLVHRLLEHTAARQRFNVNSEAQLLQMAAALGPTGHFKTFIAEFEAEPISALVAIPFGDSVVYKRGGWSGQHGDKRPNEALHWHAIQWAQNNGFRHYDFDGIETKVANLVLRSLPIPDSMLQTVTRFKLGFGGSVRLYPAPCSYAYGRTWRWVERRVYPKVAHSKPVKRALKWLRTH